MAVEATVTDTEVQIRCTGADRLFALCRERRVPLGEILSAHVLPRSMVTSRLSWRVGGTDLPGVYWGGYFLLRDDTQRPRARAWVRITRDPEVLAIELRGRRPRLIAVSHPDRHDLAWWISERL